MLNKVLLEEIATENVNLKFEEFVDNWGKSYRRHRINKSFWAEYNPIKKNELKENKLFIKKESKGNWFLCDKGNLPPIAETDICLLYTSPSPRDRQKSRMPSSA